MTKLLTLPREEAFDATRPLPKLSPTDRGSGRGRAERETFPDPLHLLFRADDQPDDEADPAGEEHDDRPEDGVLPARIGVIVDEVEDVDPDGEHGQPEHNRADGAGD